MKLIICGDLSVTAATEAGFRAKDVESTFSDTVSVFKSADRAAVNLECALTESENRIRKCGPNLKGPANTADTLKAAGFTDCMLSNNHILILARRACSTLSKILTE